MNLKSIGCLVVIIFTNIHLLQAREISSGNKIHFVLDAPLTDVTVGTKINDSTGQVTLSNSAIQSMVIANIKFLNNATITSDAPSIAIGQQFSYLVFRATSVLGKSTEVAVELTLEGNSLTFQNIPGKQVHIWESRGVCTSCGFFQDRQKNLIGCTCNSGQTIVDNNGGCDHLSFIIQ